jgi:hypothetical protein
MDSSFDQVISFLDKQVIKELNETGFFEIWLADYTILEAFGTIQLYGSSLRGGRGFKTIQGQEISHTDRTL